MGKTKTVAADVFQGLRDAIDATGKTRYQISVESKRAGVYVSQAQLSKFMTDDLEKRRGLSLEKAQGLAWLLGYEFVFRKRRGR